MPEPEAPPRKTGDTFAWLMIALGVVAVALGLWDVLVERDGGAGGSIATIAIGVLVVVLGVQRRRAA